MRKNKKSCSIPEFCRNNNFRTLEFYKMLSRHPELARKMKANSAGERVLDEEAMMTARAILRKEKIEDRRKRSAADAANEINTLAVQIEELRKHWLNHVFDLTHILLAYFPPSGTKTPWHTTVCLRRFYTVWRKIWLRIMYARLNQCFLKKGGPQARMWKSKAEKSFGFSMQSQAV